MKGKRQKETEHCVLLFPAFVAESWWKERTNGCTKTRTFRCGRVKRSLGCRTMQSGLATENRWC